MYGHLWGTPAVRAVFDERARLQSWLEVLAALARAQAAEGIVPAEAAEVITDRARVELLDIELVAEQTRNTGHSTLGLIRALESVLPAEVHRHVYVGATVQDLTDTWTSLALRTTAARLGATCAVSRSCCSTWPSGTATPCSPDALTGNRVRP
jgi:adenylosuccinate lyase